MAFSYSAVTVTITAGTLANGSARQSTAITTDTTNDVRDYRLSVKVSTQGTTTPAGAKAVHIWAYESDDGGSTWTGNAGSADAAITLDNPHQFALVGSFNHSASAGTRVGNFSMLPAFGSGVFPQRWGIIIENQTGMSWSAVAVTCHKVYEV